MDGRLGSKRPPRDSGLSIDANEHDQGGSLQDCLMQSTAEPRLVVETPRSVEEQTANQDPELPTRYAQMIILVEVGSA